MTRKNIILLTIAAAIAAFLFPPYTIKNHSGVVLDSGYYFALGDQPVYPKVVDDGEYLSTDPNYGLGELPVYRPGPRIHAAINTGMLLIELVVIGLAGTALAYTVADKAASNTNMASSTSSSSQASAHSAPLSEAELKMKNARVWGLSVLGIGALVVIVEIVLSPGGGEEISLRAVKGAMGVSFWTMVAFAYGWSTGGRK